MKILAIETSCDETAVCIIEASGTFGPDFRFEILGNALNSQVAIHAPYGGVFPNLAKREHAKNLVPLMTKALEESSRLAAYNPQPDAAAHATLSSVNLPELLAREPELLEQLQAFLSKHRKPDIDCVAVTNGPGLEPALWVGVNFARALSLAWGIPLVAVNHMEGHIAMSLMERDALASFEFPLLSLLISGGHTELVLSRQWQQYESIGQTRDDAVGEAFDKVARVLGLPYPGGPEISCLAAEARTQDARREAKPHGIQDLRETVSHITFTPPMLRSDDFDFSFSGIKTEVRKYVEHLHSRETGTGRSDLPVHNSLDDSTKADIARAFEDAVAEVLVAKTIRAAEEFGAQTIVVGGGVSANVYIRQQLAEALEKIDGIKLLVPPADLATDNAVMIALAGYFRAHKGDFADPLTLSANGNLRLS